MAITMEQIKKLREETGAGVMDAKRTLEEVLLNANLKSQNAKFEAAKKIILDKGLARAEKKADRETKAGIIYAYTHHTGLTAAMVELQCETDFVARNEEFKSLAKELAMQVSSMQPESVEEFSKQEYVRDPKLTIEQLIKQVSGKVGENVVLARFVRYEVGK